MWKQPPQPPKDDDDTNEEQQRADTLESHVNAAVWALLNQMVRPVSDRTYAAYTIPKPQEEEHAKENASTVLSPDETWEAWVDTSALDRVRQLRSQVRQKSLVVQEKRQAVLKQVEDMLQRQEETQQQQSSVTSAALPPVPPALGPSVQQMCTEKAQETQEQVNRLVKDIEELHNKIPDVVQRFQETLETVQNEERQRQAERVMTEASPNDDDDVYMLGQDEGQDENKVPADERLLRFLTSQ